MTDFTKQRKEQKTINKQHKTKRNGIQEHVKILKEKENNLHMRWGEKRDFDDGEFYGFCTDFERKQEEIQKK